MNFRYCFARKHCIDFGGLQKGPNVMTVLLNFNCKRHKKYRKDMWTYV